MCSLANPSLDFDAFPRKSQQYMDSLIPPTPGTFEEIASVQTEREEEHRRAARESRRQSLKAEAQHHGTESFTDGRRAEAAQLIQKTFRGYRTRREMKGLGLDASTRWVVAIREAQFRELTRPRSRPTLDCKSPANSTKTEPSSFSPSSTAREKWKKASVIARRAGHDDFFSDSDSSELSAGDMSPEDRDAERERREKEKHRLRHEARQMGLRYFLEMVDHKHRHGSNLGSYHEHWKQSDTKENFFYWLDHGEGRHLDLEECPRDRLEREQVRYLTREERQHYLVEVDNEGRLCWAKNGERIDTTEQYRDSIHGIVPSDDPTPEYKPTPIRNHLDRHESGESSSSDASMEHKREADREAKYATPGFDESSGLNKVSRLSASTIMNKLLRKSVKKNTWIFVADTSFRLYVGIKSPGMFQHSSFLQGGRISAAGLIKIKAGRLTSLSPLSGHYRPPASNFRAYVHSLRMSGVDMRRVSVSKSYAVLVGLEAYMKARRGGKRVAERMAHERDRIVSPDEVRKREEEALDKSESAAKERRALEKEAEGRARRGSRALPKLKLVASVEKKPAK